MCGYDPHCPGKTERSLTKAERAIAAPLRRSSRHAVLRPWRICDACNGVFTHGTFRECGFPLVIQLGSLDHANEKLRVFVS